MDWTGDNQHVWWGKLGQKEGVLKYEEAGGRFQQAEMGTEEWKSETRPSPVGQQVSPSELPLRLSHVAKFKSNASLWDAHHHKRKSVMFLKQDR